MIILEKLVICLNGGIYMFHFNHVTISVDNLENSLDFYKKIWF